eukprot:m.103705 g.103705  ORF g.103705 m.103705 type:complete len:156 (-) comp8865_c0_seq2:70-537(-)
MCQDQKDLVLIACLSARHIQLLKMRLIIAYWDSLNLQALGMSKLQYAPYCSLPGSGLTYLEGWWWCNGTRTSVDAIIRAIEMGDPDVRRVNLNDMAVLTAADADRIVTALADPRRALVHLKAHKAPQAFRDPIQQKFDEMKKAWKGRQPSFLFDC